MNTQQIIKSLTTLARAALTPQQLAELREALAPRIVRTSPAAYEITRLEDVIAFSQALDDTDRIHHEIHIKPHRPYEIHITSPHFAEAANIAQKIVLKPSSPEQP